MNTYTLLIDTQNVLKPKRNVNAYKTVADNGRHKVFPQDPLNSKLLRLTIDK